MSPTATVLRTCCWIAALPAAALCASVTTAGPLLVALLVVFVLAGLAQRATRTLAPAVALAVVSVIATGIASALVLIGNAVLPAANGSPPAAGLLVAASGVLFATGTDADDGATWHSVLFEAVAATAIAACLVLPLAFARPWLAPDARPIAMFALAGLGLGLAVALRRTPATRVQESAQ